MVNSFLKYIKYEKRYSLNTMISYQNDIEQFISYITMQYEIEDLTKVTHFMIKSWLVSMKQNGMMNSSINRKLSSLRKLFLFLKRENYIEDNPARKIVAPKMGKRLPSVIRKNEIDRLLDDILVENDFSSARDKIIIEILYNTGIRRAELINIEDINIDFSNKFIKIFGKGNKQRIVPVTEELINLINNYITIRNEHFSKNEFEKFIITDSGNKLYPKFVYNVVVKNLSMVSSSAKKSPHVLRHSIATHLSDENVEINALKELLGHSSLGSTQIYTHNSIEKLKKAYVKAHPKAN